MKPGLPHRTALLRYIYLCLFLSISFLVNAQIEKLPVSRSVNNLKQSLVSPEVFVENIGQYGKTMPGHENLGPIAFGYEGLAMPVLFTPKGMIQLVRKVSKISHRQKEELEKQGVAEEEIESKMNVVDRMISIEWVGASEHAILQKEGLASAYHTYGLLPDKARGFQKITYKNIYPGIDIVYSFNGNDKPGFEYSLIAMPGADLGLVKMKIGGDVKKIRKDRQGNLVISTDIGGMSITIPVSYYAVAVEKNKQADLETSYSINANEVSLAFPQDYDHTKTMVIDPFVTGTGNLTGINAGKAKDVDFDYAGNIYVTGGGNSNVHQLAKFNAAGILQWTFSGTLTIPSWSFGTYWGGWMVEKPSGNIYLGQGFNPTTGFQVIRINTTGLYDNYITTANPSFREAWKMYWSCNNGSPQILVAGGGTNSNINFGVFVPPAVAIGSLNVTGIPYTGAAGWAQDIVDFIIDPANNDMYTIYGSLIGNPSLTNQVYKNTAPYSGASVAWNVFSGFNSVQEIQNRPYLVGGLIDNSANIFAINASYLYYWDGKNLKAFDKATGNTVGTPLVTANVKLMQGGICADNCNNIFVGDGNGIIKVYKFNGSTFDDAAEPDIAIPGFSGKAIYDLAYDDAKKLIYASGDGFVASFDISAYCPTTQYTLNVAPDCLTSSATVTVSPTPPSGATITYTLYNGLVPIASNTTGVFTGLSSNINYTIIATINLACSGTQATVNFTLPGPIIATTQVNTTCGFSNGSITATGSGATAPYTYSIDGITFQASGTFTGLAAGVYTITVKDANGCEHTKTVIILNTNGPALTFTSTNADCGSNNGTITASVTGGTAPYQYSINGVTFQSNNFFTGFLGGTYTLTVKDALGCTNAALVTITSSPSPLLTAIPATATCGSNNGTITAFGSGGTAPLLYSINGNTYQPGNIFTGVTPGTYTVYVKDANGCIQTVVVTVANSAGPTVTAVSTPAACANVNGTVTATGTGGLAPLQYSINGGFFQTSNIFTGLAAGSYTITVKDASGCTNLTNITVASTNGPTASATTVAAACGTANGSITVTASGTPAFQYSINGGASFQVSNVFPGLLSGNYIILVKDGPGCITAIAATVGAIAGPALTAVSAPASCIANNGTITATGTGGTAPLQYSIDGITFQVSNIFGGLAPGAYSITVKDALGCLKTVTVFVGNASGLSLQVSSIYTSCNSNSGSITATATGGVLPLQYSINGVTYQASNLFTGLASGTYTLYVKDANNCIVTQQAIILSESAPTLSVSSINATCGSSNAVITAIGSGGVAPLTYSINGITYQASGTFLNVAPGIYTVYVKDASGCTATQPVTITTSGVGPGISTFTVNVKNAYPCNGSLGKITNPKVNGATCGSCTYSLNNGPFIPNATQLFLNLSPGTYLVTAMDASGCTKTISVTITNATLSTASAVVTGTSCSASTGTITLTGIGPNTPYHASISGIGGPWITFDPSYTFTGLAPGIYTIILADDESFDPGPPIIPGGCLDTITVIVPSTGGPTVSYTNTPGSCGNDFGIITVHGVGGVAPLQYSIDGVFYQADSVFTGLSSGSYTVSVMDANGCVSTIIDNLNNGLPPAVDAVANATTCGLNNGSLTLTGSGGTAPYQYSINGTSFQAGNSFTGLAAGTYTVYVKDQANCYSSIDVVISITPLPAVTAYFVAATCNNNDGIIVANGTSGIPPYEYSINGTVFQSSNTFTGLAAGFYTITIKDASGCINTSGLSVTNSGGPTITATSIAAKCGNANGTITIVAAGGTSPYQYSIDGVTFQASNIFSGLVSGTYTVIVKDANGCINSKAVLVSSVNGPQSLTAAIVNAACGLNNGSITASASGGTSPYQYSIDGITYQASTIFNALPAASYTLYVKDINGCIKTLPVVLINLTAPTLTATTSQSSCSASDGTITAIATGGTGILTYSINGVSFQASNIFTGLAAGPYTITVKDARGCTTTFNISVTSFAGATVTATTTNSTCSAANGTITASGLAGVTPYQYSINGITFQASNIFTGLLANTYTVTIKDANNCTNTTTVTVSNTAGATVTATATNATCGSGNGTIMATGAGGTLPYQYSLNGITFQVSNIFSGLPANIYTVTIKDANNCTGTTTVTVTAAPIPSISAVATNTTCGAANGTITATGASGVTPYQYSINGITFQASNLFSGLTGNTYTVTIKDANNCTGTVSVTVGSSSAPNVIASSTNTTCGASNGTITATGSNGTTAYQYSINGITFQASNLFSGLAANTYTVTIKDANNCTATTIVVVGATAIPSVTAVATNTTCGAANGTITATGASGVTPYQYSINGITFQASNVFNGLAANTYTVTIKDANNCIGTATVTITNIAGATVTAVSVNSTCGAANGTITATGAGGTLPYQFSLDGITFQASNVFTGLLANTYTVTIKDANNCINTTTVTVSNTAGATVTASPTNSTCGAANGTITATGAGGTTPYQYSINGITFQASNTFTGLLANTYTVTIKDANNCTSTTTVTVNNTAGATVTATSTNSTCGAANGTITAAGAGGTLPYQYSINGITFFASNIFNGLLANTYTVTIKDANNCSNTTTVTVNNTAGATVTAVATNATCGGSNGTITATGTGGTPPYQYSINGVTFQPFVIFAGLAANTYTVTIKDANNCINTTTVTISAIAIPAVTATATNTTCGAANGTITATGSSGVPPYQYSIDGVTYQASNIFLGVLANTYFVYIKDANNCIGTATVTITNAPMPTVTAVSANSTCGSANGTITATGISGVFPYQYSINGITFQASNVFSGLLANTYTVTIKDANNCTSTTSVIVNNTASATVTAVSTNTNCGASTGTITATGTGGTGPYQYSIDGITFQASNLFTGLAANTYTVTIKDFNNCISTTTVTVANTAGATVTAVATNSTCGAANGTITATGTGGTAPYQYSINGVTFQASNVFTGVLANTYIVSIRDANNCINTTSVTVNNTAGATVTAVATNATCGSSNGTITVTGAGGTLPYLYSINGVTFQPFIIFAGLAANTYTVTIKDANNCINTTTVTINAIAIPAVTATATNTTCGAANGTITATGSSGVPPYQYSINGVTYQASNIFLGVLANTYFVYIKDANNCIGTATVTITNAPMPSVTAVSANSTCGAANGTITSTGFSGVFPYQFSINGITFQASNVFTGLLANTYTVTIKDANNCTSTTSVTVNNTAGATVSAVPANSTCGASNGTITATGAGGVGPYQYSIDGITFQASNVFSGLASNTYTVTIKDFNNCISTTTVVVGNTAAATVTAVSANSTCGASNGTITATGAGGATPYQYSINGITFQASNIFSGLAANTYTVTIKDANNCTSTTTVTVSNTAGATVTAVSSNSTCGAANGTITATGTGGVTPYQYSIDGVTFQASNIFSGLAANTYTVTIKDANNCISTTSVTVNNTAGATVTGVSTNTNCGTSNGTVTATAIGGTAPYQYSINGVTFQASNIFTGLAANTYTITIRDANNCTSTTTAVVANTAGATVTAVSTNSTCGAANGTITATGAAGLAPYQYAIDGITFQASNVFTGLLANTYTITIRDANNCINTTTVTVNNTAGATVTAVPTNTTCGNANGTISATGTGGNLPYQYSINGITFQASNIFGGLLANTYTVTIKDANNCINTTTVTITNIASAIVTAVPASTTCGASNGTITATGTGGTLPYQYSINGITFQAGNVFSGLAANTYTVTIKDANNCISSTSVTITNIAGATVTAVPANETCGSSNGTIVATGAGGTTPYQYSINGITFQASNIFSGLAANTYTVTIKDANNCINTTTVTINNIVGATITAVSTNTTCGASNGTITATGIAGTLPYQYSINGITFQASNVFSGLASNTYTVTIKDANNCTSTATVTITNIAGATVTAVATNTFCGAASGTITATGTGGTAPYQYSIDGISFQSSNVFNGLLANTYTVTIKDVNNCINTTTVTISNTAAATVTAVAANTACGASNGTITATGTAGVGPYQYSINGIIFQAGNVFSGLAANTYTVTIKDANNCINTTSVTINNINAATVTAISANSTCGNANGSITATGAGGTAPYQYSINGITFQLSNVFNGLAANTYTITIKDASNCTSTTIVTVNNTAAATVTAVPANSTCGSANGIITATGTGGLAPYQYSINGITFQASNIFTGLLANNYTVTIRDANNCINTTVVTVSNTAGATVNAFGVNTTCGAANGTISATGAGGTPPYQYSIDGITFQANNVFNGLLANTYTVTIKDANNCTSITIVTINNIAGATVTANSTNSTCGSSNGTITATGAGGTPPYQYSINSVVFQASNIFNSLLANTYTVTIKDANNCINTVSVTVNNTVGATVTAVPANSTCGNANGTITATGAGGTTPYQYSINGINFFASNVFSGLASNPYTVFIKDANGCINSTTNVIVNNTAAATVTAIPTNSTCGTANGTITATGAGGLAPYQYSINGINFFASNVFSGLAANTYTVTIMDANNCISTVSVTVNNTAGATVTAIPTNTTCGSINGMITATGTGGLTPYQYSINGINFQAGNVFNGLAANSYTVTIKDANNCINTTTVTIGNTTAPTVTAIPTNTGCTAPGGTITATGAGGAAPYQYSINGINYQASNVFSSLAANTYTVSIKDANGCIGTVQVTVSLTNTVTVNAGADLAICEGGSAQVPAVSNGTTFSWSPATGLSNPSILNPIAAPAVTTSYFITATTGSCTRNDTVIVVVKSAPIANAGPDKRTCSGTNIALQGSGGSGYQWTPATYLSNPVSANPTVVGAPAGTYTYILAVTALNGCPAKKQDTVIVTVLPPVSVFAGNDTSISINQPLQLNAHDINNVGFISYSWSPSFGLNNSGIQSPIAILNNNITYTVTARTTDNCVAQDDISIKVFQAPEIYVPSAFTPNNDGLNDVIRPILVGIRELKYFTIFNRYGQQVFTTTQMGKGWDGVLVGQGQNTGAFVWIAEAVDFRGNIISRRGTVVLIR